MPFLPGGSGASGAQRRIPARPGLYASLLCSLLLVAGCTSKPFIEDAPPAPGGLISAERLQTYPGWLSRLALWAGDMPGPTPIRCGVRTFRLEYWTRDARDHLVLASGLYAEPTCAAPRAVLSYQHGSVSRRNDVPSTPGLEGLAAASVFAGGGYLTVAADYLGLGRSAGIHPYFHVRSTVNATRDLLVAARAFAARRGRPWPEALLLTGFSQGGHATAALHRALEQTPLEGSRLLGSALGSAPFDLADHSFPFALAGGSRDHTGYLTLIALGYSDIYGHPISSLLREPWASLLPGALEGAVREDDLPRDPRAIFTEAFLAAYDAGEPTWLLDALAQNSTFAWAPRAPMRVYVGNLDQGVSPIESQFAVTEMQSRGGNAELVNVGDFDHKDAALQAVPLIRAWFDALAPAPTRR